jgi:hypothetical protein
MNTALYIHISYVSLLLPKAKWNQLIKQKVCVGDWRSRLVRNGDEMPSSLHPLDNKGKREII